MAVYDSSHVKNIVLLGHAGSGKTTLAESMLFEAGITSRLGQVSAQNTVSDFHPLEKERGSSVFTSLLHAPWRGYKINILDTPGYDDFVGEVVSALRVADTGIMLLNAEHGVEISTDLIWDYVHAFKTPLIFAVNKLDGEQADFDKTVQEAVAHFGSNVVVVQYPRQQGAGFHEIVDVLHMVMYKYPDAGGKPEKCPIPADEKDRADALHKALVESIASNDEQLMERYFEKGNLEESEMKAGLRHAMIHHELFPVFCLSAERNMGSGRLMGFIDHIGASAHEMPPQPTKQGTPLPCDASGPVCLFVFKTISESHVGEMSLFKVYSGTIKAGMELVNENTGVAEKIQQLFVVEGHTRTAVSELVAGDIGATIKLKNTHVNNTLHEKGKPVELLPIIFPNNTMTVAIAPTQAGEEEKLAQALHHLREEDATLQIEVSPELKQTLLHVQGDLHLQVVKWKIEHQHGLSVKFSKPRIAYRETIRKMAESTYRHKKQSGGAGQFGEVYMRIEPWHTGMADPAGLTVRGRETHALPWGGELVYYNCIVGGAIDTRFLPSILKGVMEKMQEGPVTGSPVQDVRVSVYDGRMHPVDSNDIAFKIAGLMAFKQAFQEAAPQVLEPILQIEVLCPAEHTGTIMGDLQSRRALVEGMEAEGHFQLVRAQVPQAELDDYSSQLRSLTQGRARFRSKFDHYAPVPVEIQQHLAEMHRKTEVYAAG